MPASLSRSITSDEIASFHRDGAVLIKGVLSSEWLTLLGEGLDAAIAEPDVMSSELESGALRVDQFPAAKSTALRRFIEESPIAEIVGRALGSPVAFYMDQMFHKPAGPVAATPWHQDTCYYNLTGDDLIRAWVSPDAVTRDVSMEVVRGSHRWNTTYAPLAGRDAATDEEAREQFAQASDNAPVLGRETYEDWSYFSGVRDQSLPSVPDIEQTRDSFDILGWEYEPGDVLLFHGNILHSACGGVVKQQARRAHASLWAGRDVRYLHRAGQIIPDPIALYDHQPQTGQPLTDFSDVFPILWG